MKIKKRYNLKIASLSAAFIFLLNSAVYGIGLPNKSHLRVPVGQNDAFQRITEVFQLEQDAKDFRAQAIWLIRQAIVEKADPYRVREILLELIELKKEINWGILIGRISRERIEFVKIAHKLLQQAIAVEKESGKLMKESVRLRQNSYNVLNTSFLNAARRGNRGRLTAL